MTMFVGKVSLRKRARPSSGLKPESLKWTTILASGVGFEPSSGSVSPLSRGPGCFKYLRLAERSFVLKNPRTKEEWGGELLNRKEGALVTIVILATFIAGVFASTSASQVLNVFVTNFPKTHVGQDPASLVTLRCQHYIGIALELFCWR